jgi:hypothetical protein
LATVGIQLDAGRLVEVNMDNSADAIFGFPFDPAEQILGSEMTAAA